MNTERSKANKLIENIFLLLLQKNTRYIEISPTLVLPYNDAAILSHPRSPASLLGSCYHLLPPPLSLLQLFLSIISLIYNVLILEAYYNCELHVSFTINSRGIPRPSSARPAPPKIKKQQEELEDQMARYVVDTNSY